MTALFPCSYILFKNDWSLDLMQWFISQLGLTSLSVLILLWFDDSFLLDQVSKFPLSFIVFILQAVTNY